MTRIHFDGFYCSQSIAWEDWHAGVRMHGECYHFRRYFPNHSWLGAYRDTPFDFWSDSEQFDSKAIDTIKRGLGPIDKEANPLWIAGTYEIANEELIESIASETAGGYAWVTKYMIMDDRIVGLGDEKYATTFLFKPAKKTDKTDDRLATRNG